MKNIILSMDDETYRQERIAAIERNTTVTAMVREYPRGFARPAAGGPDLTQALFAVLDRAQGFSAAKRVTREQAHDR